MLTLFVFILILSLLVLIHEFGHFITAKKFGVKVEEFGLGLPPKLLSKKIGETEYTLNLLPFGGFVRLEGEEFDDSYNSDAGLLQSTHFLAKSPWKRLIILCAGVFMNLLLAFVLYYLLLVPRGFKSLNFPLIVDFKFPFGETYLTNTVIMSFDKDSPAKNAGILPGEAVLEIDNSPVYNVSDVRKVLESKINVPVNLVLLDLSKNDPNALRTVTVTTKEDSQGNGILGVYLAKSASISYLKPIEKLLIGPMHAYNMFVYSAGALKNIVKLSIAEKSAAPLSESVAGPVGIYTVVGSILSYNGVSAYLSLIDFMAIMSLSLAFINILPFPALDGGRVIFIIFELLRGKRVSPKAESYIHRAGMFVLLAFILLITIKDVLNIF